MLKRIWNAVEAFGHNGILSTGQRSVCDLARIAGAKQVERYATSAYGTVRGLACPIGKRGVPRLLYQFGRRGSSGATNRYQLRRDHVFIRLCIVRDQSNKPARQTVDEGSRLSMFVYATPVFL